MQNELTNLIEQSIARVSAMTPEERAVMHQMQAESYARSLDPCKHGKVDWEDCVACRHEAPGIRMTMQNELPEWAVTVARETVVGTMAQASPLFIERVARALVAAERRGVERAAETYRAGSGPETWDYFSQAFTAIRQLGEDS